MNKLLCRYLCYYPATLLKGEYVSRALRESRRFQWLNRSVVANHQLERAKAVARWAQENSPYYRQLYEGIDIQSFRSLADFSQLPPITKEDLINHDADIVTPFGGKYETKTTGGSTGHPVRIVKNANALAMERAVTWRAYEWAGVSVGDPQGRFWGVPHSAEGKLRALITDLVANRKRVSAFDLNESSLERYYRELERFKPSYLYGYVSVIEALANFVKRKGLPKISSVKSIITTSEVLYPRSREVIESALGVKVYNEYGCGEVGSIAHECEQGQMHIMADNLLLEVDGAGDGELLVTDFYNYKTPLIRYRVGDYGRLTGEGCACGRGLPVLSNIYGRAYDLLTLKNGTSIHPESLIYVIEDFKAECDAVAQFQAIQTALDQVDIFIVPKGPWSERTAERLIAKMKSKLSSDMNYRVELVNSIQREKSGKMRLVKSDFAA